MTRSVAAEFESPEAVIEAARQIRERGYRQVEAYTPYPIHELDEALAIPESRLPWGILVAGLLGAGGGYGLQWLLVAYLYPLNVGGRPPHAPPPFMIITFEMGILLAGLTAFFGVFVLSRLPRLWDRMFEVPGFERASIDRFWLRVDAPDDTFDADEMARELVALSAVRAFQVPGGRA